MTKPRGVFCIVKRESAVFICYYLLLITFSGIYGQKVKGRQKEEEPQSVQDLFNTSSCIPKPFRCPHKQIQFFLYTRRTQENPDLIDTTKEESLYNSQFNRKYPVKIVVHGFGGGRNLSPSTDMREAYFYRGNYNIFIVDYGTLVKEPCLSVKSGFEEKRMLPNPIKVKLRVIDYQKYHFEEMFANDFLGDVEPSISYVCLLRHHILEHVKCFTVSQCDKQMEWAPRFCAKCIAQLIRYLTQHPRGVRADDLHLIGYSVGAHISGLVANFIDPGLDGKLGRITGLDPTIFFYMGKNSSRDLDATDAHFVDILHTGAGILGQWGPNGHADFYINGGSSQPGCGSDTIFKTLACDHTKVTPYFIESIITKKGFWAYPCPTLISFMLNWCSPDDQDYVLMGEHVTHQARGIYYVRTHADPPWAQGPPLEIKQRLAKRTLPILQRLQRDFGDTRR